MPNLTDRPLLTRRFDAALVYASDMHRLQFRKGTAIPYLAHPLAVAGLVLEHGGNEDEGIAGLLHDVVEDCGRVPQRLSQALGQVVSEIERRAGLA